MRSQLARLFCVGASLMLSCSLMLFSTSTAFPATRHHFTFVGSKTLYLALGDSLAFGYQPNLDWVNGYTNDFFSDLKTHGVTTYNNLACPGETTTTMIKGGCPFSLLRKSLYAGPQLQTAVDYLRKHAGQVSPVTLDIGANDLAKDLKASDCTISTNWKTDLATLDANLTQVILPQLVAALTVNGKLTGDLLLMNYYDPYQNLCPASIPYVQQLNQHLAADAADFAALVDVFTPFGGATTPDPNTCTFTWICSSFKDIHAKDAGYRTIATAFEQTVGY